MRRCRFEQMEPRQLLSAAPIHVGAVYFEDAGGEDIVGDRFQITFSGGAPGTQLTQLVIETDKNSNGVLDMGDCFFDTQPTAPGDFGSVGFGVVSQAGIDSYHVSVSDGGDTLTLTFTGFDPGETFIFSIDVDEQGWSNPNAVAEGGEFEGSRLLATFEADHFAVANGMDVFLDKYDSKLTPSGLNLPADDYYLPPALPVPIQTAGAVFQVQQQPLPITISGTVFEDLDVDNARDTGESGIAGVSLTLLELVDQNYISTGKTTVTAADGSYHFDGMLPGTYRVVETQPTAYLSVGAQAGTVDGQTRGEVFSVDVLTGIELLGGDDSIHNDFAEVRPARLAGNVYHDADDDGIFDSNETGIGGALVRIERVGQSEFPDDEFPSDDDVLLPWDVVQSPIEVYTNADGSWSVDGLFPGEYIVTEVTPTGYFDGKDAAGTAGGLAHNPGDSIDGVILAAGQAGLQYNFGELLPSGLCGYVYVDVNNNGLRETGEAGIVGVEVILLDASGNPTGETRVTDAEGHYCFQGLHPGVYGVTEVQPNGYYDGLDTPGTLGGTAHNPGDKIDQITLGSGQKSKENNFGERLLVGLNGYVYADDDNDGVMDTGEAGIAGVTLKLLDAQGNATGTTTVTDANGYYLFEKLPPGTYGVVEVQPSGWYDGLDTAGSAGGVAHNPGDSITGAVLEGGMTGQRYNFGELRPANIAGNVFVDLDGDCIPDTGEKRIPGVTVYLLDASGKQIASTQTNANGEYRFDNLKPGTYGVKEVQPAAYLDGADRVGSAGGVLANDLITAITLASGVKGVDYNFCEITPATISGYVFQDGPTIRLMYNQTPPDPASVRDGKFTSDDTPLAGVVLQLGDGSGAPELDAQGNPITTVTNSRGYYEFKGLAPGVYTIYEVHPAGYYDSIDTAGSVGGLAVNPSDNIDPLTLAQLAVDPKDDAIIEIVITSGTNAVSYNFSEVRMEQVPPPPPPPPPHDDPEPPIRMPGYPEYVPVVREHSMAILPEVISLPGGSGLPPGSTWHLSVINGGQPRRFRQDADTLAGEPNGYFNAVSWTGADMNKSQWILTGPDGKPLQQYMFGMADGIPITGDFNGDGVDEIGVFIAGQWFLDLNGNGVWDDGDLWAKLGDDGDLPVTGDWDGDGKTDIGIFGKPWQGDPRAVAAEAGLPDSQNQPTGRYKNLPPDPEQAPEEKRTMKRTAEGKVRADLIDHVFNYGTPGDRPVAGDWNGDGISTIGVFRNGSWFLDMDGNGRWSEGDEYIEFGQTGDVPVVGDFNRDGIDEIGVYRAGKWYLDTNGNHQLDAQDKVYELGGPGDVPVVGDFDADGGEDLGVFRTGPAPDRQASR